MKKKTQITKKKSLRLLLCTRLYIYYPRMCVKGRRTLFRGWPKVVVFNIRTDTSQKRESRKRIPVWKSNISGIKTPGRTRQTTAQQQNRKRSPTEDIIPRTSSKITTRQIIYLKIKEPQRYRNPWKWEDDPIYYQHIVPICYYIHIAGEISSRVYIYRTHVDDVKPMCVENKAFLISCQLLLMSPYRGGGMGYKVFCQTQTSSIQVSNSKREQRHLMTDRPTITLTTVEENNNDAFYIYIY